MNIAIGLHRDENPVMHLTSGVPHFGRPNVGIAISFSAKFSLRFSTMPMFSGRRRHWASRAGVPAAGANGCGGQAARPERRWRAPQ